MGKRHLHGSFSSVMSGMIGTSADGASYIFHKESGAVWPLMANALLRMTKVLDGKAENFFQFDTALSVRPVISATERLPPRAAITAFVDVRCAITYGY